MIGFSGMSRKYYHKADHYEEGAGWTRAKCPSQVYLTAFYTDDKEDLLNRLVPHLTRCPKCWGKEQP